MPGSMIFPVSRSLKVMGALLMQKDFFDYANHELFFVWLLHSLMKVYDVSHCRSRGLLKLPVNWWFSSYSVSTLWSSIALFIAILLFLFITLQPYLLSLDLRTISGCLFCWLVLSYIITCWHLSCCHPIFAVVIYGAILPFNFRLLAPYFLYRSLFALNDLIFEVQFCLAVCRRFLKNAFCCCRLQRIKYESRSRVLLVQSQPVFPLYAILIMT